MRCIKCSGCGANLNFDGTHKIMKCQYCGTVYKDDSKYAKPELLSSQQMTVNTGAPSTFDVDGDRPKFSIGVFIFLLCLGFFPIAFLYLILAKAKQKAWDDKHGGN